MGLVDPYGAEINLVDQGDIKQTRQKKPLKCFINNYQFIKEHWLLMP